MRRAAILLVLAAGAVAPAAQQHDSIRTLVDRLELERYKATIKSLTAFGDRREGTDRNRAAIDWIEGQLRSYGCATARLQYEFKNERAPRTALPPGIAVGGGRN